MHNLTFLLIFIDINLTNLLISNARGQTPQQTQREHFQHKCIYTRHNKARRSNKHHGYFCLGVKEIHHHNIAKPIQQTTSTNATSA